MSPLKQSVPDWCFYRESDDPITYYQRLKMIGFEGVEMLPPERWAAARQAGLKLVNIAAPGMQAGLNRLENHASLIPQIEELIEVAKANQIEHIIIFSGNRDGQPDEESLRNTIQAGNRLASTAERAGVVLALEVLNAHDHPDYQADHTAFAMGFARAISSPMVKVLYDIYHMARMGEDVIKDVSEHMEYIAHLHTAGSPGRDFPGPEQEIDYAAVVKAAQATGYTGFWGQEFLPTADRFTELEEVYKLFNQYTK